MCPCNTTKVMNLPEKMPPTDWPAGKSMGIILISDLCRRTQTTLGGVITGQVVLDWIRKQGNQFMGTSQ